MAFQLSPGVNVSEIDLTTVVPSVATSDGAIAGVFRWGPVGERVLIDTENLLVSRFGKPTNFNAETWFTAANFLSYSNRLWVSRAANTSGVNVTEVFNSVQGNTIFVGGNTSTLTTGMFVSQVSNSSAVTTTGPAASITVINSTAFSLPVAASGTDTGISFYFANPQTAYSAVALASDNAIVANLVNQIVKNENDYTNKINSNTLNFDSDVLYVAKYPGAIGNSIRVAVCDSSNAFSSNVVVGNSSVNTSLNFTIGESVAVASFTGTTNTAANTFAASFSIGDQVVAGNSDINVQYLRIGSVSSNANATHTRVYLNFQDPYRLRDNFSTNTVTRNWEFFNAVEVAPGQSDYVRLNGNTSANDELHVVVVDDKGSFTGTPGTILEVYKGLSRATDAKNNDGSVNYYTDVININSNYIWFANHRSGASSADALNVSSSTNIAPGNYQFALGTDGFDEANASGFSTIASAYDMFVSPEDVDISLVLQGRPIGGSTSVGGETVTGYQLANYIIDNIVEVRKDCVGLISPEKSTVLNNTGREAVSLKNWRGAVRSTSYAVLDSGYKYQYDRYNDIYRWIPLNGDIAGLCARTDQSNDAWWSPAGFNRGQIKNIVKLAYNPRKAERDILYSNGINPVVAFPGQGTVLYGDKTLQAKPSAFDRINVRRLFIVLEKAISTAAKFSLFEFNDSFTRAQFKNLVTPYLRNIQGRRGITDFLVVCDDTNNTAQVIDSNQFVGDIYIKPARSINFIQLNFVAVGTGVQFSEVVGRF
jgi:phage tail sheath protein FI